MPAIVTHKQKSIAAAVLITAVLVFGCSSLSKTGTIAKEQFHLYLLIGQSNMAGRGEVGDQDRQSHPRVFTLNKDNIWIPAADPIHFDKPI
ncbi:sialate O-acetylesterase, partial [Candidatus Omnitrophota bacterium]